VEYLEIADDKKINFKFKKPGFKKLVIFDLDETLIHCRRDKDEVDSEEEADYFDADEEISI
jgi:hypothetical protein